MQWVLDHLGDISSLGLEHIWLSGVPLVLGLLISIPVGWLATRTRWLRGILITGSGLLYTIPSLALFVLMPLVLVTRILSPPTVVGGVESVPIRTLVRTL